MQAEVAYARQLAAQSELLRSESPTNLPIAVRLAAESLARDASAETDKVLWRGLVLLPTLSTEFKDDARLSKVRFAPYGCCVITGSEDGTARMIDVRTGIVIGQIRHHKPVWDVAISPDGEIVATASADGTARISQWRTGKMLFVLKHGKGVRRVLFSADGLVLGTASEDGTGRIWNVRSGKELARIAHSETVWDIAFSPDGRFFATGGRDNRVRIWDRVTSRQVADLATKSMVWSISFSNDGDLLAAGTENGLVDVWRTAGFSLAAELSHGDRVMAVGFSPNAQGLVTISFDGTVRLWSLLDFHEIRRMQGQEQIMSLAFSHDGRLVGTGGRTAQVWDLSTGDKVSVMALDVFSYGLAFSPDSEYLATASNNQFLRIWKLSSGQRAFLGTYDHDPANSVPVVTGGWVMSDDRSGNCLVTGSPTGIAITSRSADGERIAQFNHGSAILSVATALNCGLVATGGNDGMIRIWHLGVTGPSATLAHEGPVVSLAFNDDGSSLISASEDNTARVWDVGTGRQEYLLRHTESVHEAFFVGPSEQTAVTIAGDGLAIWELRSGKRIAN